MKYSLPLLATALLATAIVGAQNASAERAYGTGGCGVGSMIMGAHSGQIAAMTTNDTTSAYTQMSAISSGTSNCTDDSVVKKSRRKKAFIESNKEQLANDISKGSGETVASLATLFRCTDSKALGAALQNNYRAIFPTPATTADHVEEAIQTVITTDLKQGCLG